MIAYMRWWVHECIDSLVLPIDWYEWILKDECSSSSVVSCCWCSAFDRWVKVFRASRDKFTCVRRPFCLPLNSEPLYFHSFSVLSWLNDYHRSRLNNFWMLLLQRLPKSLRRCCCFCFDRRSSSQYVSTYADNLAYVWVALIVLCVDLKVVHADAMSFNLWC